MERKPPIGKGRPRGSVNKVSIQLRDALESRGFVVAEKLIELWNNPKVTLEQRISILYRILSYTHPKIKELDLNQPEGEQGENAKPVTVQLQDLVKIARGDQVE
jgi:hypothetical protein